jgi:hypothetical protein
MSQISWEVNRSRNKRGEKKWAFDVNVACSSSFYARDFRLGEFGWSRKERVVLSVLSPLPSSGSLYILRSPSVITYYLSHIIETGWDKAHTGTDALVSFFINLDSHPAHSPNDTPEGKQALVWHQAHARVDWNRKLADFKKKVKDLSIHNNVTQAHALHLYTPMHCIYLHPCAPCVAPSSTVVYHA